MSETAARLTSRIRHHHRVRMRHANRQFALRVLRGADVSSLLVGIALSGALLALSIAIRFMAGAPLVDRVLPSYPWSSLVSSQVNVVSVALLAGGAWLHVRSRSASPAWLALGMLVWPMFAMTAEIARDATTHNLLPFEIATWSVVFLPVYLAGKHAGRLRWAEEGKPPTR